MSILTKIFVVLVTVLAIALVPLMVAYVENTQHFQGQLQAARDAQGVATARANLLERRNQQIQSRYSDALAAKVAAQSELESRLVSRLGEIKQKETRIAQLQQESAAKDATIDRLSATGELDSEIIATLRQQEDEAQDAAIEAREALVEETGRVQALRTDLELLNENFRLVKEQLSDANAQIANLQEEIESGGTTGDGQSQLAGGPEGTPIRGLVTSVDELAGGETLVAINVGSNDEVKAGMNFIIHRGGEYIATMEVIKVDPQRAAGRVTLKEGPIEPNLQVTTPLRGF